MHIDIDRQVSVDFPKPMILRLKNVPAVNVYLDTDHRVALLDDMIPLLTTTLLLIKDISLLTTKLPLYEFLCRISINLHMHHSTKRVIHMCSNIFRLKKLYDLIL